MWIFAAVLPDLTSTTWTTGVVGDAGVGRVAGAEHGEPEVDPVHAGGRRAVGVDDPRACTAALPFDGTTTEASMSR